MKSALILKTSNIDVLHKLFVKESNNYKNIDCLITKRDVGNVKIKELTKKYHDVNYIDIERDGFYDLPQNVMDIICASQYDTVFITLSGKHGYNYWNVLDILKELNFKNAYFFNCDSELTKIERKGALVSRFIIFYIKFIDKIYSK